MMLWGAVEGVDNNQHHSNDENSEGEQQRQPTAEASVC